MANFNFKNITGGLTSNISPLVNSVNISGTSPWSIGGNGSISIQDLTGDWSSDPHVKKYQVLEIEEDLLALSCAWQRIRSVSKEDRSPQLSVTRLTDSTLFRCVSQADHDKAAQVRDYYSKKIMLWKLKGVRMSAFREDMNSFIHTDGKVFKENMQPLVYRLPEFYDYDSEFDVLSNEYNKKVNQDVQNTQGVKRLKLAKTFVVNKKHTKRKEYWFSDENNDLVSLVLALDNPLLSLLDLHAQSHVKLSAIYTKRERDNNEYLTASKFKFI